MGLLIITIQISPLSGKGLLVNETLILFSIDFGWLVVLSLTAIWDSISVYIGPFPREREDEEGKDRGE